LSFKFSVPAESVTVLAEEVVKASCKTQELPAPLNVKPQEKTIPFEVNVCAVVVVNVIVPVLLKVLPAATDQLPPIVGVPVPTKVMPVAEAVKFKQGNADTSVTV
jgi:hypothetical protein